MSPHQLCEKKSESKLWKKSHHDTHECNYGPLNSIMLYGLHVSCILVLLDLKSQKKVSNIWEVS